MRVKWLRKKVPEADQIIADASPAYRRHQRQQRTYWLQGKTLEDCKGKRCGSQPGAGQQQQLQDEPQNGKSLELLLRIRNATSQMQAAIATSSIDTVKATISNIKAQQAAAAALTPEQLQAIAEAQAQGCTGSRTQRRETKAPDPKAGIAEPGWRSGLQCFDTMVFGMEKKLMKTGNVTGNVYKRSVHRKIETNGIGVKGAEYGGKAAPFTSENVDKAPEKAKQL